VRNLSSGKYVLYFCFGAAVLAPIPFVSGCAGGPSAPPPPAITVSVSPPSASVQVTKTQQFTATVANTSNTAVTWQVAGVAGGDATHGTISSAGMYQAPAAVPNPASVTVTAVSQADNTKSGSATVTVTAAPDTTSPSAPTNLTATAVSASQINLTWTASTDNVGVTGYRVERCQGTGCSNFAQIATPSGTNFNDTGLSASTSYSYRVRATDGAGNLSGYSNTASATTQAGSTNISVSLSPKRGGLTVTQTMAFTATVTNDTGGQGVTWSATAGTFSNQTATTATYAAPATAGTVTITATSKADVTKSASTTVGVTDLAGVFTYRGNPSRDGANQQEYALTTSNVKSSSFGKLFSCAVDGEVYAQPLWVANLSIGGGTHNVIFAATENDSVYAFDADTSPCHQYWKVNFLSSGVTTVPPGDTGETGDINKKIGITGTPVIDPSTKTLYVVAKTKEGTANYHQRLHALSLTDGSEKFGGPADITSAITVPGTGDTGDSSVGCTAGSGNVPFCPLRENQRPGLALANGVVYVAWASHGDRQPYHGWVIGFNPSTLARVFTYNDSPNGFEGGIWMSGGAPAIDSGNNLYLITGNGDFDGVSDFGDSFLKLSSSLSLSDWFTPNVQDQLNAQDLDLGSGGAAILVDLPSGSPVQRLLVGGGKGLGQAGQIYVLNRDSLGHTNATDSGAVQQWSPGGAIFSTPAFWQNTLYLAGVGQHLQAFSLSTSTSKFNTTPSSQTSASFGFPGATPAVSSKGTANGIVWALDTSNNGTPNGTGANGPALLHAYDATNLTTELWNSSQGTGNAAGTAVKFVVPTVANGKVYIGTQTEIDVYGLLPN
jgi:uncharacterized protein YjdB